MQTFLENLGVAVTSEGISGTSCSPFTLFTHSKLSAFESVAILRLNKAFTNQCLIKFYLVVIKKHKTFTLKWTLLSQTRQCLKLQESRNCKNYQKQETALAN